MKTDLSAPVILFSLRQMMALSLFWRLTAGYAAILLLSVGTSIYAIIQLGDLSQTARGALDRDYQTIAQQEALTEAFLSEVRYGGKYLLTQSPSSLDQFRQFKKDFQRYISDLKANVIDNEGHTQLARMEQLHQSYHVLFDQEVDYLKVRQPYAQSRYQQERNRILDSMMRELAQLKDHLEMALHAKLGRLGYTAHKTRIIAIVITLILLAVGIALSLIISESITKPLAVLRKRVISGDLDRIDVQLLSSIPEIQELDKALTHQKRRLQQNAEISAREMETLADELAPRIAACKQKLAELKMSHERTIPAEVRAAIDTIGLDLDGLIRHCAESSTAAAARAIVLKLAPQQPLETSGELSAKRSVSWLMRELPDTSPAEDFSSITAVSRWSKQLRAMLTEKIHRKNTSDKS